MCNSNKIPLIYSNNKINNNKKTIITINHTCLKLIRHFLSDQFFTTSTESESIANKKTFKTFSIVGNETVETRLVMLWQRFNIDPFSSSNKIKMIIKIIIIKELKRELKKKEWKRVKKELKEKRVKILLMKGYKLKKYNHGHMKLHVRAWVQ